MISSLSLWRLVPFSIVLLTTGACANPTQPLVPSRLLAPLIVAFGDSMTAGENGREGRGDPAPASAACLPGSAPSSGGTQLYRPFFIDAANAYPSGLLTQLESAFPAQQIRVANEGNPGESSADGAVRLGCVLQLWHPQALIILEGVNDLAPGGTPDIASVTATLAASLTRDVATAKAAGVAWIYLATLPPPGTCSGVTPCRARSATDIILANVAIRSVASSSGVTLIDVHQHFAASSGRGAALVDTDGLHLTAAGYSLLAQSAFVALPFAR